MTVDDFAELFGAALVLVVLASLWLLGLVSRLDRLHIRTDAAWAGLDAALARRAVVGRAVAVAGCLDSDAAGGLRAASVRAEGATRPDREGAENELTSRLAQVDRGQLPAGLAEELADAELRVVLARRVHNDAVRDTRALRRRRPVRWLRLAGTAPQPEYFEIAEPDIEANAVSVQPRRMAARLVLADAEDRVLLFHGTDPGSPGSAFWFTPGGGVEGTEELRATAVRELKEETGIVTTAEALTGPTWVRRVTVPFESGLYHAEEWFFLVKAIDTTVDTSGFTELEVDTIDGHRWWTLAELKSTSDTVYPEQLAEFLPALLSGSWDGRTRAIR